MPTTTVPDADGEFGRERDDASARIVTPELSWTTAENGLFMRRSIPGFYDEIAAEQQWREQASTTACPAVRRRA